MIKLCKAEMTSMDANAYCFALEIPVMILYDLWNMLQLIVRLSFYVQKFPSTLRTECFQYISLSNSPRTSVVVAVVDRVNYLTPGVQLISIFVYHGHIFSYNAWLQLQNMDQQSELK